MRLYTFGLITFKFYCGGGGVPAPAAPPPPPQLAQTPSAPSVRQTTAATSAQAYGSTLLTGGDGEAITANQLGKKTLLG